MSLSKPDFAPWLLLPGIALTLSGASLLVPRQAASAAASVQAAPKAALPAPKAGVYDDGDGDELLEHWDDPQFSYEEQHQMAGMTVGFLVLGAAAFRRRARRQSRQAAVPLPTETDFPKLDTRQTDALPTDTRKAA